MRSCKFSIYAIFNAFNFVELTLLIGLKWYLVIQIGLWSLYHFRLVKKIHLLLRFFWNGRNNNTRQRLLFRTVYWRLWWLHFCFRYFFLILIRSSLPRPCRWRPINLIFNLRALNLSLRFFQDIIKLMFDLGDMAIILIRVVHFWFCHFLHHFVARTSDGAFPASGEGWVGLWFILCVAHWI